MKHPRSESAVQVVGIQRVAFASTDESDPALAASRMLPFRELSILANGHPSPQTE
jgi:hypothetical protein